MVIHRGQVEEGQRTRRDRLGKGRPPRRQHGERRTRLGCALGENGEEVHIQLITGT